MQTKKLILFSQILSKKIHCIMRLQTVQVQLVLLKKCKIYYKRMQNCKPTHMKYVNCKANIAMPSLS